MILSLPYIYSSDLIEPGEWRTKVIRDKSQELKDHEKLFGESQKDLLKPNDDAEAFSVAQDNKICKLVSTLRKSHSSLITYLEAGCRYLALNKETDLYQISTLEIRFQKITSTKVKTVCPLFKQRNITRDRTLNNLESLIGDLGECEHCEFQLPITDCQRQQLTPFSLRIRICQLMVQIHQM